MLVLSDSRGKCNECSRGEVESDSATRTFASITPGSTEVIVDVAAVKRAYSAEMPDREFRCGFGKAGFILQQPQGAVLDEMLGIGSCLGGEPRELSFLLGSEVDVNSHARSSYEKAGSEASFKLRQRGTESLNAADLVASPCCHFQH